MLLCVAQFLGNPANYFPSRTRITDTDTFYPLRLVPPAAPKSCLNEGGCALFLSFCRARSLNGHYYFILTSLVVLPEGSMAVILSWIV